MSEERGRIVISCEGDFKCSWCKDHSNGDEPTDKHGACKEAELSDEIERLTAENERLIQLSDIAVSACITLDKRAGVELIKLRTRLGLSRCVVSDQCTHKSPVFEGKCTECGREVVA